jgi:hypothetical protein
LGDVFLTFGSAYHLVERDGARCAELLGIERQICGRMSSPPPFDILRAIVML